MQDEEKGFPPSGHNEIIKLSVLLALIAVAVLGATLGICGLALGWFRAKASPLGGEAVSPTGLTDEGEDFPPDGDVESLPLERKESPQAADEVSSSAEPLWPAGTAWDTGSGSYYFMEDGEYYYYISDDMADYIKGRISIKEADEEEIKNAGAEEILKDHEDGSLVAIDVLVDKEIYFDREKSGMKYTIYMAENGDKMAVYDSGWGYAYKGSKTKMAERVKLNDYFVKKAEPGTVETSEGSVREQPFADISFDGAEEGRSGTHLCVNNGRVLYADDISPQDGTEVTSFASNGRYLYYASGKRRADGVRSEGLNRIDLNLFETERLVKERVENILIRGDNVYYTDYNHLICLGSEGTTKDLWSYGVYCFEEAGGMIYLFDGEEWELIDADDGSDKGYISNGINYAYTCDHAVYENGYLFFSAYDYNRQSVSIRALCVEDGSELILGEEVDGTAEDVCNTAFSGSCIYYTGGDREKLIRLDLSDGSTAGVELKDESLWYISDMVGTADGIMICAFDKDGDKYYLKVDRDLNFSN
ncbi:MAG: hypothetical protein K6B44_13240 [Lachnospiraceae bacterium]|nr:hypothetical protein [Lachnospiraceae bacterium]